MFRGSPEPGESLHPIEGISNGDERLIRRALGWPPDIPKAAHNGALKSAI